MLTYGKEQHIIKTNIDKKVMGILGVTLYLLLLSLVAYVFSMFMFRWFAKKGIDYFLPFIFGLIVGISSIILIGIFILLEITKK